MKLPILLSHHCGPEFHALLTAGGSESIAWVLHMHIDIQALPTFNLPPRSLRPSGRDLDLDLGPFVASFVAALAVALAIATGGSLSGSVRGGLWHWLLTPSFQPKHRQQQWRHPQSSAEGAGPCNLSLSVTITCLGTAHRGLAAEYWP